MSVFVGLQLAICETETGNSLNAQALLDSVVSLFGFNLVSFGELYSILLQLCFLAFVCRCGY